MFGRKDALPLHESPSSNGVKLSSVNTKVRLLLLTPCHKLCVISFAGGAVVGMDCDVNIDCHVWIQTLF
jgi:hypothetical protein